MKREDFIPIFLDIVKLSLINNLPAEGDEATLRTCAWFEIERLVGHIRCAEDLAKEAK